MKRFGGFRRRNKRRYRRRHRLTQILIVVFALVFVFSAIKLILYFRNSARTAAVNAELRELHEASLEAPQVDPADTHAPSEAPLSVANTPEPSESTQIAADEVTEISEPQALPFGEYQRIGDGISREAQKLYEINPDLVAWLNIPNLINLPVVYRDNSFYLTHDFYGQENDSGTLFLDVLHPLASDTQYLFIHGHNMYDSSMFGMLTHYRKKDFIREHPELTLNTLYSRDAYEIIGSLFLSEDEMSTIAGLGRASFANEAQFQSFIETLRAHAMHFTDEEIPSDAALLALSTCFEDGRIVVIFRRTTTEAI